jgi:hypothetical protein
MTGRVVFERPFEADFATDLPWHHYPPVTKLSEEARKDLALVVKNRAEVFKPDFAAAYKILGGIGGVDLGEIKKARSLEKGHAAGVRAAVPAPGQLDILLTGNPEVVLQGKAGDLFHAADPKAFDRIKDQDIQMAVQILFSLLYPPRLVVVRSPSGTWEVVY